MAQNYKPQGLYCKPCKLQKINKTLHMVYDTINHQLPMEEFLRIHQYDSMYLLFYVIIYIYFILFGVKYGKRISCVNQII